MDYCGRFAPSPSGRLHWGSLVSGYASYFRSYSQRGKFIVRIEDLDFPRCPMSNIPIILEELELLGINSDIKPIIQGEQLEIYEKLLDKLIKSHQAYYCACSRAQMKQRPCPCFNSDIQTKLCASSQDNLAIRIDLSPYLPHHPSFMDGNLGLIEQKNLGHEIAHSLVLKRADNIIAYNLAVVLDDHNEGITEVVRGADMLDATFLQLCLYEILGYQAPKFFHVPLITDNSGNKLSKQNKAPAVLCSHAPHEALIKTYSLLGQIYEGTASTLLTKLNELYFDLGKLLEPLLSQEPSSIKDITTNNKSAQAMNMPLDNAVCHETIAISKTSFNQQTKALALSGSQKLAKMLKRIVMLDKCELINGLLSYGYRLQSTGTIEPTSILKPKARDKEQDTVMANGHDMAPENDMAMAHEHTKAKAYGKALAQAKTNGHTIPLNKACNKEQGMGIDLGMGLGCERIMKGDNSNLNDGALLESNIVLYEYFTKLKANDYIEPYMLGWLLFDLLKLDMGASLKLINDYKLAMNELLTLLSKSFSKQNMPNSAIVI